MRFRSLLLYLKQETLSKTKKVHLGTAHPLTIRRILVINNYLFLAEYYDIMSHPIVVFFLFSSVRVIQFFSYIGKEMLKM